MLLSELRMSLEVDTSPAKPSYETEILANTLRDTHERHFVHGSPNPTHRTVSLIFILVLDPNFGGDLLHTNS